MTKTIFIIGPRGCGKTTVGHALARARHFQFSDTESQNVYILLIPHNKIERIYTVTLYAYYFDFASVLSIANSISLLD